MVVKGLVEEDFINYKKASMFVLFPYCTFKCEKDCGIKCCQNSPLALAPKIDVDISTLVDKYINNPITKAVVCGGLEPFDSWEDLLRLVQQLRSKTSDDIVIYTGYNPCEILDKVVYLKQFENIIIKFGRFVPDSTSRYDDVLGVTLASDNQYAMKVS